MTGLDALVEGLTPHVLAVALIAARWLPVAYLCPLLGGTALPLHVTLTVVLALSLALHVEGGVDAPPAADALSLVALALHELLLGTCLGLVAGLPFEAARTGGNLVDLFRGSSAEAAMPGSGAKGVVAGEALHRLLVAVGAGGVLLDLVVAAVWRTFGQVPLGGLPASEGLALQLVTWVAVAFSAGLAIAAPLAGLSLAVDGALGLAARAANGVNLQELGAPLRILGGAGLLWLASGLFLERLQRLALEVPAQLAAVPALATLP